MAVNIKLKHSSVDGRAPVAADLQNGELALNINENSPAAYIKDSNGDIVKLAGAGSVTDEASVKKAGDNMTGDLTLGTVGTPANTIEASGNVTLGEADGATVSLGFAAGTTAQTVEIGTASAGPAVTVSSAGQGGGGATQNVMLLDTPLNIGTSVLTPEVSITPAGAATFAGNVLVQNGTGYVNSLPVGLIDIYRATSNTDQLLVLRSNVGGPQTSVTQFKADGSVTFASDVLSGESAANGILIRGSDPAIKMSDTDSSNSEAYIGRTGSGTNAFQSYQLTDRSGANTVNIKGSGEATFKGVVQTENADGSTFSYLSTNGSIGGSGNIQMGTYMKLGTDKCVLNLNGDGAATFAGNVFSGSGTGYVNTYATGQFLLRYDGNVANGGIQIVRDGDGSSNRTTWLKADGSAEFASSVSTNFVSVVAPGTSGATKISNFSSALVTDCVVFYANGNANFKGTVQQNVTRSNSIEIQLEADDDTKYDVTTEEYTETETYTVEVPVLRPEGPVGTADLVDEPKTRTITKEREVTKTREVRTYNGPVLSVKEELQSLRARATQQDETIAMMTAALKSLGIDTAAFPAPEEPKTKK